MKLILALCGVLSVAACSSVPMQTASDDSSRMVCDREQMARVEAQAATNRTEIVWVSCPQIRKDRVKSVS